MIDRLDSDLADLNTYYVGLPHREFADFQLLVDMLKESKFLTCNTEHFALVQAEREPQVNSKMIMALTEKKLKNERREKIFAEVRAKLQKQLEKQLRNHGQN